MVESFAPPIQTGIHMTVVDGQFRIAVSIRNPTDESVGLTTMDSRLFSVELCRQYGDHLWSPGGMAAQAVTSSKLEAGGRATRHYEVPDPEAARKKAEETIERHGDFLYPDTEDVEIVVGTPEDIRDIDPDNGVIGEVGIDPEDVGIVQVKATVPATYDYSMSVSRQYDLRRDHENLDDELPSETMEGIQRRVP